MCVKFVVSHLMLRMYVLSYPWRSSSAQFFTRFYFVLLIGIRWGGGTHERVPFVEYLIQRVKSENEISRRTAAKIPPDYYPIYTENESMGTSGSYLTTRVDTSAYDGVFDQQEIRVRTRLRRYRRMRVNIALKYQG